ILAVVTQIDKSSGRNLQLQKSAVKIKAEEYGLKILQAKKLNDIFPEIEALKPDLIIVIAYGQILKENILNLPKFKCVNVHGSLLPK
ncbi:formyltransferase family protein, partial [Escherichia coli]